MAASPVRPGEIIGERYRVERMLGRGGMAVVVAATDQRKKELVAIKVLLPERVESSEACARFMREARLAGKIKNPHVVRVRDVGTLDNGTPYMVMDHLDGEDLSALLLRKSSVPATTAMFYILQACAGLKDVHAANIVHRDLKPANLFLVRGKTEDTPTLKVLDFGISKIEHNDRRRTETKEILGSPWYMSPEQLKRAASAEPRSDIWSLGIILHELVTGEVPFDGESMTEVIVKVLHEDPIVTGSQRELPSRVEAIIRKCLAKNPEDRYANTDALADALRAAGAPHEMPPHSDRDLGALDEEEEDAEVVSEEELLPSIMPPVAPVASTPIAIAYDSTTHESVDLADDIELMPPSEPIKLSDPVEEEDETTLINAPVSQALIDAAHVEDDDEEEEVPESSELEEIEDVDNEAEDVDDEDEEEEEEEEEEAHDEGARVSAAVLKKVAAPPPPVAKEPSRQSSTSVLVAVAAVIVIGLIAFRFAPKSETRDTVSAEPTASTPVATVTIASSEPPPPAPPPSSSALELDERPVITTAEPPPTVTAPPTPTEPPPASTIALKVATDPPSPPIPVTTAIAVPSPRPTASAEPEDDDTTVAFQATRRHQATLREQCWEPSEKTSVAVTVNANVDPAGTVTSVQATAPDMKLAKCVESQVGTWTFPTSKKPRQLAFPVRFRR